MVQLRFLKGSNWQRVSIISDDSLELNRQPAIHNKFEQMSGATGRDWTETNQAIA